MNDMEIKSIPLDQDLILLVNKLLDQTNRVIELNNRVLDENARILSLLDFPKVNTSVLSDAAKYFKR